MKTFADNLKISRGAVRRAPVSLAPFSGSYSTSRQEVQHILRCTNLQPKLVVGAPDDVFEREADRVADTVMEMPEPATGESPKEQAQQLVSPKMDGGGEIPVSGELADRIQALEGGGVPLGEGERAFFEPRFGADFSRVRIHTDPVAAEAASAINARAFTLGSDIVFGPGRYAPGTDEGKRLMAHELTHVLQQEGGD
uniref:DUF4157 domain-containing protein n=1 Tax=Geobacter metallireducens TaxID=28232 RepID=A0A831UF85_GEOME